LSQGTTPRKLALTCALGVVIGIFPIWGITTWICLAFAIGLRLNVVVMQLINYLLFPAQLALILPFINMGIWAFGLPDFPYGSQELITVFRQDFFAVMKEASIALSAGICAWLFLACIIFPILFYGTLLLFIRMKFRASEN
jgi:uncharacterized protein (DUF2062 family)